MPTAFKPPYKNEQFGEMRRQSEYNFSDWTGNTNWRTKSSRPDSLRNNNISITGASDKQASTLVQVKPTNKGISSTRSTANYTNISNQISQAYRTTSKKVSGLTVSVCCQLIQKVLPLLCGQLLAEVYNIP